MLPRAQALTTLSRSFRNGTKDLARELCDACRPHLPARQARLLRTDQLGIVAGLEGERPLVASALALAPAISAAGDAMCIAALAGGERTTAVLTAAEPIAQLGAEALRLVRRAPVETTEVLGFAHRLALTVHHAADLFATTERRWGLPRRTRRPGGALWALLLEGLEGRIEGGRELAAGREPGDWAALVDAAEACRDAGVHAIRAYDGVATRNGRRPRSRLLRCLAFASLYCGFATLRDLPARSGAPGFGALSRSRRRRLIIRLLRRGAEAARGRSAPALAR